jgi:hypothetical protein
LPQCKAAQQAALWERSYRRNTPQAT